MTARRGALIAAILAVAHFALAWLVRVPAISWGEDDAAYVQLADQLRQFSYRDIHDVALPIHARFPPGFSLAIAGVRTAFGSDIDVVLFFVALYQRRSGLA